MVKVTGGALRVKASLTYRAQNQDYKKRPISYGFTPASNSARSKRRTRAASSPSPGLSHSYVGLGLGAEAEASAPLLQPVLTYQLILPDGAGRAQRAYKAPRA